MSETLPPRARLARLLASLSAHLPGQLETLLAAGRFADGAAALARLAAPEHREALLAGIGEAEATALAEALERAWGRVGEVVLEPIAALVGPDEVWLGPGPTPVALRLQLVDVEAVEVRWTGPGSPIEGDLAYQLVLQRPEEGAPSSGMVARTPGSVVVDLSRVSPGGLRFTQPSRCSGVSPARLPGCLAGPRPLIPAGPRGWTAPGATAKRAPSVDPRPPAWWTGRE